MKVSRSHTTPQFEKDFLDLPRKVQAKARIKIKLFETDCFNRSLNIHKLGGVVKEFWAVSVDNKYRVIFKFLENREVIYYRIGLHEIYKELENLLR